MLSLLAVAAVAGSVSARTGALGPTNNYIAPVGIQVGTISQSINCTAYLSGTLPVIRNATFSLVLGGALTTSVSSTGSFYLVGRANVTGSQAFTTSLKNLNATSFNGTLNSTIILTPGSTTGSIDVAKLGRTISFPSQTVQTGKQVVLNIPNTSEAPLKIGPITPASGSKQVTIGVGAAVVQSTAIISGKPVPVTIRCPANNPADYIAFVTVGGSGTAPVPGDYKPVTTIPSGSVLGSTGLNYNCAISGISGNLTIPTSLTTFASQLIVKRSAKFSYLNSHGTVNISQTNAAKVKAALPTPSAGSAFSITINQIATTGTGISPTTVNILSTPITSDRISLASTTGTYMVDIPGANGLLPPVNFTASSTAQIAYIYLGGASVAINAYTSSGSLIKTFTGSCTPPTAPQAPLLPVNVV